MIIAVGSFFANSGSAGTEWRIELCGLKLTCQASPHGRPRVAASWTPSWRNTCHARDGGEAPRFRKKLGMYSFLTYQSSHGKYLYQLLG